MQVNNVNFVLTAIICRDVTSNFVGIAVDSNGKNHILYDGINAKLIEFFNENDLLSPITKFCWPLDLWYAKKADQTVFDDLLNLPAPSAQSASNGHAWWFNWKLWVLLATSTSWFLMQRNFINNLIECETELAKAMGKMLTYCDNDKEIELMPFQLAKGLLQLKSLFEKMQFSSSSFKYLDTHPLVDAFRFSQDVEQCAFEVCSNPFIFNFESLGVWLWYMFKTVQIICEENQA